MRVSTSDITGKKKGSGSNDIFEKCRNFTRPSDLQSAGLYMYFEVFGEREGCGPGEVRMGQAQGADVRVQRLSGPDQRIPR